MASNVTRNPSYLTRPLKLAYDVDNHTTFTVADDGGLTIATSGEGTLDSTLVLDADGDIEINAAGGDIRFKHTDTLLGAFDASGNLTIQGECISEGVMRARGTGGLILGTAGNTDPVTMTMITTVGNVAGKPLTLSAGSTQTAEDYNLNGGDLILASGSGDGTGTSAMTFSTKVSGTDAVAERMRIHTNGMVGIGVADPNSLLEILGTTTQLKLSYDTQDYMSITVADDGVTTLATFDVGASSAGHLTLDVDGDIILDAATDKIYFANAGTNTVLFDVNGSASAGASMKLMSILDDSDYFMIDTTTLGVTTISTVDSDDAQAAHLTFDIQGDTIFKGDIANGTSTAVCKIDASASSLFIESGKKIEFGAAEEYIYGDTNDLTITSGVNLNIDVGGHVEFDGCGVGFDLETPAYNASDTDVNFINGNKQFVTFGSGNIADLNLIFPKVSGNFLLMLKQDGTGSRTVAADGWLVWDRIDSVAASGSATVKFAGGSNPTLTTDANHVDIISFFYDADNEIAYGVATLDFQF